jgi:hypothetical protein
LKAVSSHVSRTPCSDGTSFGLLHYGFADTGWEWQRALELAQERQNNKKVHEVIKGCDPADYNEVPFGPPTQPRTRTSIMSSQKTHL